MNKINSSSRLEDVLKEIAGKHDADAGLIQKLISLEETKVHLEKRRGTKELLRKIIESSIEEVKQ